ncbi:MULTISPECIES: FliM/FliN family flagellar motor switch protein [Rhizobium/Agrobacterium group]|jgi:flagellar motor switch protein FliM|uniref:Flagellar motor switch protein FliM n=2 Tax=Rhizobium/Agrobacterium group TaxID=227290 RepID=A0A1B9U7Q3_AGRTU|nr:MULTISPECIES: FliM/FliN family flagellar motor switch protein [Rhizobium/Agrobacterium group]AHK00421.1 flagellar motor switch protein FliM [Agrobacterium tumefaciens LBA4213 (Ach5)]EHJ98349.1 flagellar motor switch protein FliM [Agrobacterium tumefaciens 5A]KQY53680.1 flagellar motor switch protein FliM [Rhizobium sp. Root491]MBO9107579.1 flagellar motor switch protein FliM [Agrobacterium sp. S2/73]MDQ4407932.1 FliM/FliN family flagellar motor switch protein [Rhizobium sp. AN63]
MTMAKAAQQRAPVIDTSLLAKLTGGLSDRKTIAKVGSDIGHLYSEFLPDIFHSETGIAIDVEYIGSESGLMTDLIANIGGNFSVADCSLRNWCPNFMMAVGNGFVIALMERMLGAAADTIGEPDERSLSHIELDLAAMVLGRIGGVLRSGVNAPGGFEATIDPPFTANGKSAFEEMIAGLYGVTVRMKIAIGKVSSEFALIVPQRPLLKTSIAAPKASAQALKKQAEWVDLISEQVKRSQVTLEARIKLETLTLRTISRLVAGDVIPFQDLKQDDIGVEVSANGSKLYNCEFGKSGDRYMVRVKNNVSTDDEILRHLMG